MRPLVLTPEVHADVADLIDRAKTDRFSFPDLKLIKEGINSADHRWIEEIEGTDSIAVNLLQKAIEGDTT